MTYFQVGSLWPLGTSGTATSVAHFSGLKPLQGLTDGHGHPGCLSLAFGGRGGPKNGVPPFRLVHIYIYTLHIMMYMRGTEGSVPLLREGP